MSKSNQWVMGQSDQRFAWLENDEGKHVACIERMGDGAVQRLVEGEFRTSDTHWQSIIDQIAAVQEMIAALRNVQHELTHDSEVHHSTRCDIASLLKRVDPPCPVTRTVNVTMQVDVRVFSDAPEDVVRAMALAQVRKGDGFVTGGKVIS
jgi:hypothetical protein